MDLTTPYVYPHVALVAPDKYDTPLLKFLRTSPKLNFNSNFLTTSLQQKLIRMSLAKAIPKGLKDQECKKGSRAKHPPVPYVPAVNPVQDVVSAKECLMKIKLPDKAKIQVPIWHSGMPEAFFIHICKAILACNVRGILISTTKPSTSSR